MRNFSSLTFRPKMSYCSDPLKNCSKELRDLLGVNISQNTFSGLCRWQYRSWSSLECTWERMKFSSKGMMFGHVWFHVYTFGRHNPWPWFQSIWESHKRQQAATLVLYTSSLSARTEDQDFHCYQETKWNPKAEALCTHMLFTIMFSVAQQDK